MSSVSVSRLIQQPKDSPCHVDKGLIKYGSQLINFPNIISCWYVATVFLHITCNVTTTQNNSLASSICPRKEHKHFMGPLHPFTFHITSLLISFCSVITFSAFLSIIMHFHNRVSNKISFKKHCTSKVSFLVPLSSSNLIKSWTFFLSQKMFFYVLRI